MKVVVGLGNPGRRYAPTRHNAGFRVVEAFASRHGIALDEERFGGRFGRGRVAAAAAALEVALLLPLTYMNRSGEAVARACEELRPASSLDLLVVLDDVDLPLGRLRVRPAGGAGGHQGLADVLERLGHRDVPRLRFGVGRPPPLVETADYVLAPFAPAEERVVREAVPRAADAVLASLAEGLEVAMGRFNREPEPATPTGSSVG